MSKVVFAGCSFTSGVGWSNDKEDCKDYSGLWVNLCHQQIKQLQDLELVNVGVAGASNTEIFENTIGAITGTDVKFLFCQWTAMPRYNFTVGLELWNTNEQLHAGNNGRNKTGINLNRGDSYSREYLDDLLNRLLVLHHLHSEIVKVVKYSAIISRLCNQLSIQVAFINGLCPWDHNYFVRLIDALPESYTEFTKTEILNIKTRSDQDIFKLYEQLHNDYDTAGGINPSKWINLYNSMQHSKIDTNFDGYHPGTKSNINYFQQVNNFLNPQGN